MSRIIVTDICNTLADVIPVLEQHFGSKRKTGEYFYPGVTEQFFRENLWIFIKASAYEHAAEILNVLSNHYTIVYATARPEVSDKVTKQWLQDKHFPPGVIIYSKDKAKVALQLDALFVIDDAPHEIDNYYKHGLPVAVHRRDYNATYKRRFSWDSFKFDELGDIVQRSNRMRRI